MSPAIYGGSGDPAARRARPSTAITTAIGPCSTTRRGNAEVVRLLEEARLAADSADDPYGRTPLMQAAFAGGAEAEVLN